MMCWRVGQSSLIFSTASACLSDTTRAFAFEFLILYSISFAVSRVVPGIATAPILAHPKSTPYHSGILGRITRTLSFFSIPKFISALANLDEDLSNSL